MGTTNMQNERQISLFCQHHLLFEQLPLQLPLLSRVCRPFCQRPVETYFSNCQRFMTIHQLTQYLHIISLVLLEKVRVQSKCIKPGFTATELSQPR